MNEYQFKLNVLLCRIEALECSLRQRTNELVEEKQKFRQLKEDFKYNLKFNVANLQHNELILLG